MRPQRGVAAIGDVDRILAEHIADRLHRLRRMDSLSAYPRAFANPFHAIAGSLPVAFVIIAALRFHRLGRERAMQSFERAFRVGDDSQCERTRHAHIALIDIDLNELLTGGIPPILVVRNVEVAEARTGDQNHVGLAAGSIGGGAVSIKEVRTIEGHGGPARHRAQHRTIEQLDDAHQRGVRVRAIDTATAENQRMRRVGEHLGGLLELRLRSLGPCGAIFSGAMRRTFASSPVAYITGDGISRWTGPGRPFHISRNAMRVTSGIRSHERIGALHFETVLKTSS